METITISKTTVRRFVLGRQGLWPGRRWAGMEGTAQTLQAIEEVQMKAQRVDIRVLEPSTLRNTVRAYTDTTLAVEAENSH